MVSFQVPVASEIINLVNFVWSDITLIAAVMFLSTKVAGFINYDRFRKEESMNLKPFDFPHIGGGMVMNYGWERSLIALVRVSVILSVCVGNFGLQGRSEVSFVTTSSSVRVPGPVEDLNSRLLFNVTEIRMRCAQLEGDQLSFGSVVNNHCYLGMHEHSFVKSLSMGITNVTREIVYEDCTAHVFRDRYYTILKCNGMDLSCAGPFIDFDREDWRTCYAVVYDGDKSWSCPPAGFDPRFQGNQTASCRMIGARKEDIEHWTDLYRIKTVDPLVAIFGSAYGVTRRMDVDIPGDEKNVTIFTLWWIIPAIWQVIVLSGLLACFVWLRSHGSKPYGNDERSLLHLLREASEQMHDLTDGYDGMNKISRGA